MAQNNTKLIYFADPMCSWCYGFSPELTKVMDQLEDSISLQMVLGGLRPYSSETMEQLRDFLQGHWKEVANRSGQPFNYDILSNTTFVYDTEPACRAVVLMRQLQPEQTFPFFKAIQTAFYVDNQNTNQTRTYLDLLSDFGVDEATFKNKFESEALRALVRQDFKYAADVGVSGFPTLVLQQGKELYLISNGYMKAEDVLARIKTKLGD